MGGAELAPLSFRARSAVLIAVLVVAGACSRSGGTSDGKAATVATSATGSVAATPNTATSDAAPVPSEVSGSAVSASVAPHEVAGQPEGFTTATVRITTAGGEVCEVCMWLADDGAERGRGLMGVTGLGSPVGMVFVFPQPVDGAFYMFGTPTPLSIAWFAPDGGFVSSTDMEPCTTTAAQCERFAAGGTYQTAIEVFRGGLDDLGIGPGATAEVLAGTESPSCATG